ncbi:MAG: TonB-dependent receptor [Nitrospiria bacterium]
MPLLLFVFSVLCSGTAAGEEAVVLDKLEVEGEVETDRSAEDLEESFFQPFVREKVFSETIEAESIPDVKSALKEIPNVTIRELGAFTKTIEIRGLSGDRITTVYDGVRISNQGLTYTGGGDANLIDINTVDSIEVVKGSPAVIYDPGATGGVILVESKEIEKGDHLKLKYTFGYDDGLEKTRHATSLSGGYKRLGAALSYSRTDAEDYKVKNREKLQAVIDRSNAQGEGRTGADRLTDLGFNEETAGLKLGYQVVPDHRLSFQYSDYEAEDITFVIPSTIDPTLFHINQLTRETRQIRYRIEKLGFLKDMNLAYSDQELVRVEAAPSILESRSVSASGGILIHGTRLSIGGEFVNDEADTQVFSEQDYIAGYINAEHIQGDWTWLGGVRVNRWDVQAKLKPGRDASIAGDLVGVSGSSRPKEETAYTYAAGWVYSLTENNNVSVNYSKTERFPSLFERFAFGNFSGGGLDLKSEAADNFEAAWKYYDGNFAVSVSLFYSDFDNFISTKNRRRIINQAALNQCIALGRCDPLTGDFDDREDEFFASDTRYFNVKRVVNRGFEVSLKKGREKAYEAGLSFGLSDFDVRAVHEPTEKNLVLNNTNPLEVNLHYKRYVTDWPSEPWVKLKGRVVTNTPSVQQADGFNPFFVADLFAGFQYPFRDKSKLRFNAGIRNLTDKVYHEPFSPLDGLKRTVFFNISLELG